MKKLIVFDLDGTLAESKASIDPAMADLLFSLLDTVKVAIISGGDWSQFEKQVLAHLVGRGQHSEGGEVAGIRPTAYCPPPTNVLANLSLLPTCGTKFYRYQDNWKKIYSEDFKTAEKEKIIGALKKAMEATGCKVEKVWGEVIEDRGSQITFSALGQQAPLAEKKTWDPDFAKRKKMKACLDNLIPEFSVRLGGATSVDVTKPGIDKAYGIHKLRDLLGISIQDMIYVGDAVFPGGNDYPAKQAGCESIEVRDPDVTKAVIEAIIACLRRSESPKNRQVSSHIFVVPPLSGSSTSPPPKGGTTSDPVVLLPQNRTTS
jgi:HAD superfamily hydrolase (TIGR01484 family)